MIQSTNTTFQTSTITRSHRETHHKHKSFCLWFTGLSGSGKSTLAHAVEARLHETGHSTLVLDGDNIRHGLCSDLSFSDIDRVENIRRTSEVAKLLNDAGVITLVALISPFLKDRETARNRLPEGDFYEIYCHCPIETCEERDVKGLYKKARMGEIPFFTGIDSPYEVPINAEITINTNELSIEDSVEEILSFLKTKNHIHR